MFSPRILRTLCLLIWLGGGALALGQTVISEFMAANVNSAIVDEDGSHEDWLEIYNPSPTASVSLNGWYLTDTASDLRKWQFPVTSPSVVLAPGGRLVVWCSNKNRKTDASRLHTNFKLDASGEYLALVRADGVTVEHSYAPVYPSQFSDVAYGISGTTQLQALIGPSTGATSYSKAVRVRVPASSADLNDGWAGRTYAETGTTWYDRTVGLESGIYKGLGFDTFGDHSYLIHTSGGTRYLPNTTTNWMYSVNGSMQVRIPFTVADASAVKSLQLKLHWEDGFLVYLNGALVASQNAPAPVVYNSVSSVDRLNSESEDEDLFSLNGAQAYLQNGTNVLAIQGLNNVSTNGLFLLTPALDAQVGSTGVSGTTGYLQSATPGTANSVATTAIGPIITQTTDAPVQPTVGTTSFLPITTRVRAALNPVASVTLYYRVMFGSETALAMDDTGPTGAGGDAVAGDGIYSTRIPVSSLTDGQMVRWRIQAADSAAVKSSDPVFADPLANDQYFGTVATNPPATAALRNSLLPALHWFVDPAEDANTRLRAGTRCAVFYPVQNADGSVSNHFYDNVFVNLHGQSSAGFPVNKKSHNFNFNRGNGFKARAGEERMGNVNLLTNYADKTKLRNTLAWGSWPLAGHPAHWCLPVRVQKNAAFWGVYDLVEDASETFLDRVGLSKDGALYKAYNYLDTAAQAVNNASGLEKKTREYEDFSDVAALVAGISSSKTVAARLTYLYDNVSVPRLINFLAMQTLLLGNDTGHKNYYVYRDTLGTGEWSVLPYDQDLSLGHTFVSGPNYFDDDIDSQAGLTMGGTADNRLMGLVYSDADLTRMYLRRLRSLMDQLLVSGTATTGSFESRIAQLIAQIDPHNDNAATGVDDADEDMRTWGFWVDGSSTSIAYTNSLMPNHQMRVQAARLQNSNPNPPNPASNPNTNLSRSTLPAFLAGRRSILYGGTLITNGEKIPATAQSLTPSLNIESIDFNPTSATQEHEYFVIKNTSGVAVDLSGWKLSGAVSYLFPGGTVVPAYTTGTNNVGLLHVAKNPRLFRQRTSGPTGGQNRLVVGPYDGQLSARGETIVLSRPDDPLNAETTTFTPVVSATYSGAPTSAQLGLRVTEINYAPAAPTSAESSALPGVSAGDFEYIEVMNTGLTTLGLAGATFQKGVEFTFPSTSVSTMAAGSRRLVVANLAAFRLRYGTGLNGLILGEFQGSLDNAGEELQLVDTVGEVVLEFSYAPDWYPPTLGGGRTLVARVNNGAFDGYGAPTAWAIGGSVNGTPGSADSSTAQVFEGWRWDYFTSAEFATALNPTAVGALSSDPDRDGLNNFNEYVFARNPRVADHPGALSTLGTTTVEGTPYLTVTFTRLKNALDLNWVVEGSSDLVSWSSDQTLFLSATDLGGGREQVVYRDVVPAQPSSRFLRVTAFKQ